jgi:hypothetical protein
LREGIAAFESEGFRFQAVSGTNIISPLGRIKWESDPIGLDPNKKGHYGYELRVTRAGISFTMYLDGSYRVPTFTCPVQLPGAASQTWLRSSRPSDLATMVANFQRGLDVLVGEKFAPTGSGWTATAMADSCINRPISWASGERAQVGFLVGKITITRPGTMIVDPATGSVAQSSLIFQVNVVVNLLDGRIGLGTDPESVDWMDRAGTRFGEQVRKTIDQIATDPSHSYVLVQPAAVSMSQVVIEAKQFTAGANPTLVSSISMSFVPGYVQRGCTDSGDIVVGLKVGNRAPITIVEGGSAHGHWTDPAQVQSRLAALADFITRMKQEDSAETITLSSAVRDYSGESMCRRMDDSEIFFLVEGAGPETWIVRFDSSTPGVMATFAFRQTGGTYAWDVLISPQTFIEDRMQ